MSYVCTLSLKQNSIDLPWSVFVYALPFCFAQLVLFDLI